MEFKTEYLGGFVRVSNVSDKKNFRKYSDAYRVVFEKGAILQVRSKIAAVTFNSYREKTRIDSRLCDDGYTARMMGLFLGCNACEIKRKINNNEYLPL